MSNFFRALKIEFFFRDPVQKNLHFDYFFLKKKIPKRKCHHQDPVSTHSTKVVHFNNVHDLKIKKKESPIQHKYVVSA